MVGLQFRNLLNQTGVIQEEERERPLSGWQMLFLHEHLFHFNCFATVSSTDLHSCLLPFRRVRGERSESEEVRGKLGGQKMYKKAPCPTLGFYDAV